MKPWMLSFALISLVLSGVFGGDFLSPDFTSCALNKPEGVKAIASYSELYTKHKVAIIFSASQSIAQFEKEKAIKP